MVIEHSQSPHIYVSKGWGHEEWICNFDRYCGKILVMNSNKKCSMHFHAVKDEVLYCDTGSFNIIYYWDGGEKSNAFIINGMSFHIPTGLRHQMIAGPDGAKIIEFSTHHEDSDSIRIEIGD